MIKRILSGVAILSMVLVTGKLSSHAETPPGLIDAIAKLSTADLYELYSRKRIRFVNDVIFHPDGEFAYAQWSKSEREVLNDQFAKIKARSGYWVGRGSVHVEGEDVKFEALLRTGDERKKEKCYSTLVHFRYAKKIVMLYGDPGCSQANVVRKSERLFYWGTYERSDLSPWSSAIIMSLPLADQPALNFLDPHGRAWTEVPVAWAPISSQEYIELHDAGVHEYNHFLEIESRELGLPPPLKIELESEDEEDL